MRDRLPIILTDQDIKQFWSLVKKTRRCWLWTGIQSHGYGLFRAGPKLYRAHRVAWKLLHGSIPAGVDVLHKCDNRLCVRHLFLGTNMDNQKDMMRKERGWWQANGKGRPAWKGHGEHNVRAKMTEAEVRDIRQRYKNGQRLADIARAYPSMERTAVGNIARGKRWAHVR